MDNLQPVVNEQPTPVEVSQTTVVTEEVTPKVAPGDKTEPNLLLKSLQEERIKRQALEDEIEQLKSSALSESQSDEGVAIMAEIKRLNIELSDIKQDNAKKDILISNPILKDKWEEFETFRTDPENKGMNMRTAAKAFLIESGLSDTPRKGLEKTTGGSRVPLSIGMSVEDVKHLRETDPRKWKAMAAAGQLNIQE